MQVVLQHAGLAHAGGVSVDVRNLERGLRERGVEVGVVATARELSRELARRPGAIAHVFGCLPSAATFGSLAIAKRHGRRLVWTPVFHPSRPSSWRGYGLLRAMALFDVVAPHAARLADAVLAATSAEAAFFATRTRGIVRVIPPGVDRLPSPVDPASLAAFRARAGLDEGPTLLTVARDNSRKALPFGLAAFAELRRRRRDAQLLLVGPDATHAYGSRDGVRCPGWLAQPEMELAYSAARALWVPSLYEGLPRAVIEAWRLGIPVVATDRVALAPLIGDGRGDVVPFGDTGAAATALERMLADDERAARLGDAGRRLAEERFLLPRIVADTEALYRELTT